MVTPAGDLSPQVVRDGLPRHHHVRELARRLGVDAVLAGDAATVTWLTGMSLQVELGPSPFSRPPVVLVPLDGPPVVVASEDHAGLDRLSCCEIVTYPGYTLAPLAPHANLASTLRQVIGTRSIATEPAALLGVLPDSLQAVDATGRLRLLRAVKDEDELLRIRRAVTITDIGQAALREFACAGRTEFEVWLDVQAAMERVAGLRLPIAADLVSGSRTAEIEGPPGARALRGGDLVIADLLARVGGYWSDSCTTIAVGSPSQWAVRAHQRVRDRLMQAIKEIRPGVVAGDLDARMRAGLDYPHHSGHGIGTTYHEEPRIVPGSTTVLESGMVVALEPGLYGEHEGVRLEWVVAIRADGAEILSAHGLDL